MKKSLIIVITMVFIGMGLSAADPIGSGSISFNGLIEAGLYFTVSEVDPQVYNLIENEDLQPDGDGVDIGTWTLRVDNPPVEETDYTVTYSYDSLSSEETSDTIEFIILERKDDETLDVAVEKEHLSSSSITISSGSGLNVDTRILSARLTVDGAADALLAAASEFYQAEITIALAAE
ncbi:MAG: hypothetical protein PQJ47_05400 [Sphaerochaetaceae bacterium]|nr:hypothetical protein [Sphaerochaetaceae bacterium]MDC7247329.1 hypothetical protein [Sphaerochaetaceae bacterium]